MSSTARFARACARRWLCATLLSLASLMALEAPSAAQVRIPDDPPIPGDRGVGDCDLRQRISGRNQKARTLGQRGFPMEIMAQVLRARFIRR